MKKGVLFLIPNFLGEGKIEDFFPALNIEIVRSLEFFIVENAKNARAFLKMMGNMPPYDEITFFELNKHTKYGDKIEFIAPLKNGENVGLISEAGMPAIADPGGEIVFMAHKYGIKVEPLIGPSSILMALVSSGFNGQKFTFHGYIPINREKRVKTLKEFEKISKKTNYTQIFIETPYRNQYIFGDILSNCAKDTFLSIAKDLNTPQQMIKTLTIGQWKKQKIDLNKKQVVFIISANHV